MNLACIFSSVDIFLAFSLFLQNFNFYIPQFLQITSARVEGMSDLGLCTGRCNYNKHGAAYMPFLWHQFEWFGLVNARLLCIVKPV